jgi:hypothetical protein
MLWAVARRFALYGIIGYKNVYLFSKTIKKLSVCSSSTGQWTCHGPMEEFMNLLYDYITLNEGT